MTDVRTIDEEYKQRLAELTDKLGRPANTHDAEYWQLTDWYRSQHQALIDLRDRPHYVERYTENNALQTQRNRQNYPPIICTKCGQEVPRPMRRGRPPTKHVICPPRPETVDG